jgi:hypothetical protein
MPRLRVLAVPVLIGVLGLAGCVSYAARISVLSPDETPSQWTPEETARAVEIVQKSVVALGFESDPGLPKIRERSARGEEYEYRVIAQFIRGGQFASREWVEVSALSYKDGGRFVVLIRDFNSAKATDLTRALEEALAEALISQFPSRKVETQRQTLGPALGP